MRQKSASPLLSVVAPVYNERDGLPIFHKSLTAVLEKLEASYEIIYVDDGSVDGTISIAHTLAKENNMIRVIRFSRNFGKEIATTAGLHAARGEAVLTIDADGQHPVELIPEFLEHWRKGAKVVIGVRTDNQKEGLVKRIGSKFFYGLFQRFTGINLVPGSSDYRLIDRQVQLDFMQMTERNRITRGLIDWLGYKREYIYFKANARVHGTSPYTFHKLVKLAVDSVISLSLSPLYLTAYLGAVVLPLSTLLGVGMLGNFILDDPLHLHATGGAYLLVLILFLVGVLLVSQGIIGLYLSHIHTETQNRPLYIIDTEQSVGAV